MTSAKPVVERFGPPSRQAKAENIIARLVLKPFIWASAALADVLADWTPSPLNRLSPHPAWRHAGNLLLRSLPVPDDVAYSRVKLRGVAAERFVPPGPADTTVIYFHGGGFVIGGPPSHRLLTTALARATGAVVLVPDYRMPPQIPFPDILTDCLTFYRELLAGGQDPKKIVFAGDSAGGYLTIATAQAARDAGLPTPAGIVPLAPWLDLRKAIVHEGLSTEYVIPLNWPKSIVTKLVAPHGPQALANPVDGDLTGLPPALLQVSSAELLYPQAVQFADALAEAGVPVTLQVWDGVMHVFQLAGTLVPESKQAIANIAAFVRAVTAPAAKPGKRAAHA